MTPPDVWVPVPLRWRHVQPGDVVLGGDGTPWLVSDRNDQYVTATRGKAATRTGEVDPDEVATVLIPATERDALTLTRAELGARVESRRLNQEQGAA